MTASHLSCPMCLSRGSTFAGKDRQRPYYSCSLCRLMFVPPPYHLSAADEKIHYDHHHNNPQNPAYRRFLNRLAQPLQERLQPGLSGLDFGSGPGPTLSVMFQEAGYAMSIYDPLYAYNPAALARTYDFITATEVVEHLKAPGYELDRLWGMLVPDGMLGIMTQLIPAHQHFLDWAYIRDSTHICFFSEQTWNWLADHWQAKILHSHDGVIIFQKKPIPDHL